MSKKVVVGLSGGIDSSVSAYLLKKKGYLVEAVYMNNWDSVLNNELNLDLKEDGCQNKQEFLDAMEVAKFLNIKLHVVDFISEYWNKVFLQFIKKYELGLTPNPDVLCNKFIKFEAFRNYVFENFDADFFALGHYANKIVNNDGSFDLGCARDASKDQTYFLCELNQKQLEKVIFPIGEYEKKDIRKIAKEAGLFNWDKKDSTGICFIGKRNFKEFISNYIEAKKGPIIDFDTKEVLAFHNSIAFFTIGQRKNLGLSGFDNKYYVCQKDAKNNILYVSKNLEKLNKIKGIQIDNFNWINKRISQFQSNNVLIRYRHCGQLFESSVLENNNKTIITFNKEQTFIAIGQYAVIYKNNICLGGGEISKIF